VKRLVATASAAVALACANAAREYRDPDPALGPTALVVITNPFQRAPFTSGTRAIVHLYEGSAADCAEAYLGSVSLDASDQTLRVAAGREAIFRLSLESIETLYTTRCSAAIGFVPEAEHGYRIDFHEHFWLHCSIGLTDESGESVAAFDPRYCESP
jgi:hypothetical protein